MKQEVTKILRQVSLFFLLFFSTVSATNAQYTLTDDDVVVTGGIIQSCSYDFAITDIIIPATLDGQSVEGIRDGGYVSDGVFYYKGLTSIELPASLTHIGDYAFCSNSLTEINLPNNLIYMGELAFNHNQITTVNGAASDGIFYARKADATIDYTTIVSYGGASKDVTIPAQVVVIGTDAFILNSLTSVDFSACTALTTIGQRSFWDSFLTSIDLSACTSLITIKSMAFWGNSISSLNLSGCTALTTIGALSFRNNQLASIDLSTCTALTNVDFEAFRNNNLTEIKLPNSITSLGGSVFNGNKITTVNGMSHNGIFYARTAGATIDSTTIVSYGGVSKEVIIPAQVVTIGTQAFASNSLTSVDFSACTALADIGTRAFQLNSFGSVDLSACTSLTTIRNWAFAYSALTNIDLSGCTALTTIQSWAFYDNSLVSVNLSGCNALTAIQDRAFNNNSLANIDLSACTALTYIGSDAFSGNPLTEFMLPTPDITGYKLNYWKDADNNEYSGGATVTNLQSFYTANLSPAFKVTFTITDGVNPIEGANVQLGSNGTVTTNADGIAFFAKVLPANDIAYTVSSAKYDDISGTVSVIDSDISKELMLNLTTYDVTFTINSGTEAVAGATVSLSGYGTATSDASGIATFTNVALENDIAYTVSAPNYDDASGTVSVVDSDVSKVVTLSLTTYNVTFTINSGTEAVAGATVSLNGYGTAISDTTGIATFTNVLPANNIAYTVSVPNYDDVSGAVSVVNSDVNEEVTLSLTTYNVTFTINSGTDAVAGATVSLNGYGTATSDASGIATFTNVLPANNIAYTVSAPNYDDASGTVSVVDSDVSEDVQLAKTTTGFDELGDYSINVYPNPTTDILTITQPAGSPLARIEFYTTSGLRVKVEDLQNNSEKITLNVYDLVIGSYILKCITRNNHTFISLIMKK